MTSTPVAVAVPATGVTYALAYSSGFDSGAVWIVPMPTGISVAAGLSFDLDIDDQGGGTGVSTYSIQIDAEFVPAGGLPTGAMATLGSATPTDTPGHQRVSITSGTPPLPSGYMIVSVRRMSSSIPDSAAPMALIGAQAKFKVS